MHVAQIIRLLRNVSARIDAWLGHVRVPSQLGLGVVLVVLAAVTAAACASGRSGQGLLAGRSPSRSDGVLQASALNDGVRSRDGDHWNTELTAVFRGPNAFVEYDLGAATTIRAAYLVGDNNDEYVVSLSDDGSTWRELWVARPSAGKGQQPRLTDELDGAGRYVRVAARGGDRSYSVSEFAVFDEVPAAFPPAVSAKVGLPGPEALRSRVLLFAFAVALWLVVTSRRLPWFANLALVLIPVWAGIGLTHSLIAGWPPEQRDVSLVRGVSAGLAGIAIVRELLGGRRWPASRGVVLSALGVSAFSAAMAFYNLGHPQFYDQKNREDLFVHNFDMRVYFPIAKYFKELRFDGLYQASVAAYVADDPSVSLDSLAHVELRDLKTHRMRRVSELREEINAIPRRFSPERWESFKVDMRYFRETMGVRDYLGSMRDHGGNATPVWFAIAHLIFANTNASNQVLFLGGLLDPLLLALAALAIWRAYGVRTMLFSVVVFGANDFYMFGSNWAGATLRHDWMAYLALGLCALRLRWWVAGGALLALSALIRAFPALALVWVAVPAAWWVVDSVRVNRRGPRLNELWTEQQPLIRTALGAIGCVLFFFLFSSLLFSFDAWGEWLAKVRLLDRDPHVNHVSLRALVAGSGHLQHNILQMRLPIFVAAIAGIAAALAALARNKPLDQAAALGTLLIPVVFNPANYYIHFIYVLPVLALELRRRERSEVHGAAVTPLDAGVWLSLVAVCAAQYWTTWEKDTELHFQFASVLLFAGITALLVLLLKRDYGLVTATPTLSLELARAERPAPPAAPAFGPHAVADRAAPSGVPASAGDDALGRGASSAERTEAADAAGSSDEPLRGDPSAEGSPEEGQATEPGAPGAPDDPDRSP